MTRSTLIFAFVLSAAFMFGQLNITIQAPVANSNTQLRAPNGTNTHAGLKACFLIRASELTSLTGSIVNSIGFDVLAGTGSNAVAGNFTLYLQNTNDVTYTKGTSFSGAIAGMSTHFNGIFTVPVNGSTVTLNCTPTFTYNGGGIYVAYEFVSTGPFSIGPATYAANLIQGGGLGAASFNNPGPAVNTMTVNDFRPAFVLNAVNTATNEAAVTTLNALGKFASVFGTQQVVAAQVKNSSNVTLNNIPVTLNVTGANPTTDIQNINSLAAGATATVVFAAFTSNVNGINNMSVSIPSDDVNTNNQLIWTQSVTCSNVGLHPANIQWTSSFGFGGANGSGCFMSAFVPPAAGTLSAIQVAVGTASQNAGKQMWGVVANAAGNIIATSNTITIVPGTTANLVFNPPVPVNALTPYLFGAAQPAAQYYPMAHATFTNFASPAYYVIPLAGGAPSVAITDAFLGIEPVFGGASPIAITGNTSICSGSSATLTASGAQSYTWSNASNSSSIVVSPTITTSYSVSSGVGNCLSSQNVQVQVATNPTLSISGGTSACVGAPALVITASGAQSYTWSNNANTSAISVSTGTPGTYPFTVTAQNAPCPQASESTTITINDNPTVTLSSGAPTVCTSSTGGGSVQLTGAPQGGNYTGSGISGTGVFTPGNTPGSSAFTYSYTDSSTGCSNSATTSVQVLNCQTNPTTSIGGQKGASENVSIFPNPAHGGIFTITGLSETAVVSIYNVTGELVMTYVSGKNEIRADLSSYAEGIYLVKIATNGAPVVKKVVVKH